MQRKKSKKGKALRRRLMAGGLQTCFYCGLPFGIFILPKGSPAAAKSRRYASLTLEHLEARSLGGTTTKDNCVLAHGWCNAMAANRPLADKILLKESLSNNIGVPPWWPLLQKIIAKQTI
jgi:hypothetical protein